MRSLDKIVVALTINGVSTEHPGLFYGKTGIAVFFFHYARHTGDKLFENYAMDLINEILEQMTVTLSPRYDVGLAGIGTGFEYFLQNGFLEQESDDIFENLDMYMYHVTMHEPYLDDLSLEGGLTGWGRYFIYRLRGKGHKDSKLHEALTYIATEITKKTKENRVPEDEKHDVYRFLHDLTTLPEYAEKYSDLSQQCKDWKSIGKVDVSKMFTGNNCLINTGLSNGWANEGLLHLTFINKEHSSWLNLL